MSRSKGNIAELKSCEYLHSQGYKILEQNYYAKKLGEIDIIALKDDVYHFIEVKSAQDYEIAVNNITPNKISKIKKSIEYYLQTKKIDVAYCLDAVVVIEDEITFLENITL